MRSPRQFSLSIVLVFSGLLSAAYSQEITNYFSPDVKRVGQRLACRCAGCRNTVGDCPMLRCGSSDPKRQRIYEMKKQGLSDDAIVNTFVREEGIVALSSPPSEGFGPIVTWLGPGIALLLGFGVYSWYVRRNQAKPAALLPVDQAVLDRFRAQIDRELDDSPISGGPAKK